MNDSRRNRLEQASKLINEAIAIIKEIGDEEQDLLANLPQNLKDGERGDNIEATIDSINDIVSHLEEALDGTTDALF
jgi:ABC-type transporter Mla subunit MlaD